MLQEFNHPFPGMQMHALVDLYCVGIMHLSLLANHFNVRLLYIKAFM